MYRLYHHGGTASIPVCKSVSEAGGASISGLSDSSLRDVPCLGQPKRAEGGRKSEDHLRDRPCISPGCPTYDSAASRPMPSVHRPPH
jgi:hypothetical protein